jgi:hypothetical protein
MFTRKKTVGARSYREGNVIDLVDVDAKKLIENRDAVEAPGWHLTILPDLDLAKLDAYVRAITTAMPPPEPMPAPAPTPAPTPANEAAPAPSPTPTAATSAPQPAAPAAATTGK